MSEESKVPNPDSGSAKSSVEPISKTLFPAAEAARLRYFENIEKARQAAETKKRQSRLDRRHSNEKRTQNKTYSFKVAGTNYRLKTNTDRFSTYTTDQQLVLLVGASKDQPTVNNPDEQTKYILNGINRYRDENEQLTEADFGALISEHPDHLRQAEDGFLELRGLALEIVADLTVSPIAKRCKATVAAIRAGTLALDS